MQARARLITRVHKLRGEYVWTLRKAKRAKKRKRQQQQTSQPKARKCRVCGKLFDTALDCQKHRRAFHGGSGSEPRPSEPMPPPETRQPRAWMVTAPRASVVPTSAFGVVASIGEDQLETLRTAANDTRSVVLAVEDTEFLSEVDRRHDGNAVLVVVRLGEPGGASNIHRRHLEAVGTYAGMVQLRTSDLSWRLDHLKILDRAHRVSDLGTLADPELAPLRPGLIAIPSWPQYERTR